MHITKGLFSAAEAFARLGQSRESGCLVVVSDKGTSRIFTKDASVVFAIADGKPGEQALEALFSDPDASYVWMPGVKPEKETMSLSINVHALKTAMAYDIHLSKTSRVSLDSVDRGNIPAHKKVAGYFLLPLDGAQERFIINKSPLLVGRDESCDFVIPNPRVSRRHCMLTQNARGLNFKDLESTNGIFVNGIRAKEGILQSGERLKIANYEVYVQRDAK